MQNNNTIEDGSGTFGIVKVLVINEQEAHLKIYKNKYEQRPSKIDIGTFSLGSINDKDGFGIGHGGQALSCLVPGVSDESDTREEKNGSKDAINQDLSYAFVTAATIDKGNSSHNEANNTHNRQDDPQYSFFHIVFYKVSASNTRMQFLRPR